MQHRGSFKQHEQMRKLILSNTELVGIPQDAVLEVHHELELVGRKRPIAQPDLTIHFHKHHSRCVTFVEIKSGAGYYARQSLRMQMIKIIRYKRRHKIQAEVLGVYQKGMVMCVIDEYAIDSLR